MSETDSVQQIFAMFTNIFLSTLLDGIDCGKVSVNCVNLIEVSHHHKRQFLEKKCRKWFQKIEKLSRLANWLLPPTNFGSYVYVTVANIQSEITRTQ